VVEKYLIFSIIRQKKREYVVAIIRDKLMSSSLLAIAFIEQKKV